MPRPVNTKLIITILEKNGFIFVSQKGSHRKYRKKGKKTLTVIVPIHGKEIPYGTFRSILRQSDLGEEMFQK